MIRPYSRCNVHHPRFMLFVAGLCFFAGVVHALYAASLVGSAGSGVRPITMT